MINIYFIYRKEKSHVRVHTYTNIWVQEVPKSSDTKIKEPFHYKNKGKN